MTPFIIAEILVYLFIAVLYVIIAHILTTDHRETVFRMGPQAQFKLLNRFIPAYIVLIVGFLVFTEIVGDSAEAWPWLFVPLAFFYLYRFKVYFMIKESEQKEALGTKI